MTLTFYAYWNGAQTAELFSTVAGLTSSSGYKWILAAAAIAGLIAASFAAAVKYRAVNIIEWFIATILFFCATLIPKVDVNVYDVRSMSVRTVAGVPVGVGFIAAASSGVGKWLAEAFENAFTDVDAAKFTKFGWMFPERAVEAINNAGPLLPETKALMTPIIDRCVMPEILEDKAKLAEVLTSPDLSETINASWVNPARFILHEGRPVYCDEALALLTEQMKLREIPHQEKILLAKIGGSADAMFEAQIRQAIPTSEALLLGISRTMSQGLAHSIFSRAVPSGILKEAGKADSAMTASIALSKAQGGMAAEIGFRAMSELAQSFLPRLRNVLEYILIAAFPIVFLILMAVGAAGMRVLQTYVVLFFWLSLWAPLASVVNSLLLHFDREPLTSLVAQYGGLTIEAAALVREMGATSQAMAGYTMLLIPLVSYIIAKGSDMSAASLASSIMNPAQGAALGTSTQSAQGNVSMGNASSGNFSANNTGINKTDLSSSYAHSNRRVDSYASGSVVSDSSSGSITAVKAEASNLGFNTSVVMSESRANSSSQTSTDSASSISSAYSSVAAGSARTISHADSFASSNQNSSSMQSSSNRLWASAQSVGSSSASTSSSAYSSSSSVSDRADFRSGFGAGASAGVLSSASFEAGLDSGVQAGFDALGAAPILPAARSSNSNSASPAALRSIGPNVSAGAASSGVLSDSASRSEASASSIHADERQIWSGSESSGTASSFARTTSDSSRSEDALAKSASKSAAAARQNQSSIQDAFAESRSEGRAVSAGVSINLDAAARDRLLSEGSSAEEVLQNLNNPAVRASIASSMFGPAQSAADREMPEAARPRSTVSSGFRAVDEESRRIEAEYHEAGSEEFKMQHAENPAHVDRIPASSYEASARRAALRMGSQKAAARLFNDEAGLGSIALNSISAGAAYSSPGELRSMIEEKAFEDERLRENLILLGRGEIEEEEFLRRTGIPR